MLNIAVTALIPISFRMKLMSLLALILLLTSCGPDPDPEKPDVSEIPVITFLGKDESTKIESGSTLKAISTCDHCDPALTEYSWRIGRSAFDGPNFTLKDTDLLETIYLSARPVNADQTIGESVSIEFRLNHFEQIVSSGGAFAARKTDGTVTTWGNVNDGGDSSLVQSQLVDVVFVAATRGGAFAALRKDGSIVTWGNQTNGGDSSSVSSLTGVRTLVGSLSAFAAITSDRQVVTWGSGEAADSSAVTAQLTQVKEVIANNFAFAAIKIGGQVVTWGHPEYGGDSSAVTDELANIWFITASGGAFAAWAWDSDRVITWGSELYGGKLDQPLDDVMAIAGNGFSNRINPHAPLGWHSSKPYNGFEQAGGAFAALKRDGSVVVWGELCSGGDKTLSGHGERSCSPQELLEPLANVSQIVASQIGGFTAIKKDGTAVFWGYSGSGPRLEPLAEKMISVTASSGAFAGILADGSVTTWGSRLLGGDSANVASQLHNVVSIAATDSAFAALKQDGSIVTWGDQNRGGDSRNFGKVFSQSQNIANSEAFASVLANGNVLAWGSGTSADASDIFGDVQSIAASDSGFAALNTTGEVMLWGYGASQQILFNNIKSIVGSAYDFVGLTHDNKVVGQGMYYGGDVSALQDKRISVESLASTINSFAGLRADGTVLSWNSQPDPEQTSRSLSTFSTFADSLTNVVSIAAAPDAYAALRADGKVETWPSAYGQKNVESVPGADIASTLTKVKSIYYGGGAFSALKDDHTVSFWGGPIAELYQAQASSLDNIASLTGTQKVTFYNWQIDPELDYDFVGALAILQRDGTVISMGFNRFGGDSSAVQADLTQVKEVVATSKSFAAIKMDGTVVAWGEAISGGDSSQVDLSNVRSVVGSSDAFVAFKEDGSAVSWGNIRSMTPIDFSTSDFVLNNNQEYVNIERR